MKTTISAFCTLFLAIAFGGSLHAQGTTQNYQIGCIGFYNFENLFDTLDSPNTNDFEFTPNGEMRYNTKVYTEKLANLSKVVAMLGEESPDGVAVLGVSEIENRAVLEDFVKHPNIAKRNYQIIHFDSPDKRGIDAAIIYNPKYFEVLNARPLSVSGELKPGDTLFTRDIILASGLFMGEPMHVMVGHWPSRRGGEKASDPLRRRAAKVCRDAADSIFTIEPNAKIIIMGDLNDDPVSPSVAEVIGAKGKEQDVQAKGFFSPFYKFYKKGIGTLGYNDAWNLFDQIIISHAFLNKSQSGVYYHKAVVFNKPFLISKTGRFKGYPFRTYSFGEYIGGYSDHLPTFLYFRKIAKK
jgi:hypothetical protein